MLYKFKCKWYDESIKNEEVTTFGIIGGCQLPEATRKICDKIIDEKISDMYLSDHAALCADVKF